MFSETVLFVPLIQNYLSMNEHIVNLIIAIIASISGVIAGAVLKSIKLDLNKIKVNLLKTYHFIVGYIFPVYMILQFFFKEIDKISIALFVIGMITVFTNLLVWFVNWSVIKVLYPMIAIIMKIDKEKYNSLKDEYPEIEEILDYMIEKARKA